MGIPGSRKFLRHRPAYLWAIVLTGIALAAGAGGAGVILAGSLSGETGLVVGQAAVVDQENLSRKDITLDIEDAAVTVNDEGTGLILASEFQLGEPLVFDVPLANKSNANSSAQASLSIPAGFSADIEEFWSTRSRSDSPNAVTSSSSLAMSPLTAIAPQPSDTLGTSTAPSGTAGVDAQVSTGAATTSSPGLPVATPQTADGTATTTKPSGVQDNDAQETGSTATSTAPSGSTDVSAQTSDGAVATTTPDGLDGVVASRRPNFVATTTEPNGTPDISKQIVTTSATTTRPDGAATSASGSYQTGNFSVDIDADGTKDTVHFLLVDTSASSTYDTLELSTDDDTFGEATGGPLTNGMTGPDDDERITSSGSVVRLGPFYYFKVSFDSNGGSASIESTTWFTATIGGTDLDGDGDADDTFHAALTDDDSDGIYEHLDLSVGDQSFGEEPAIDDLVNKKVDFGGSNNLDDERLTVDSETDSGSHHVRMGVNTFTFTWETTPGGGGE